MFALISPLEIWIISSKKNFIQECFKPHFTSTKTLRGEFDVRCCCSGDHFKKF